jgi:hypothetical protein
MIDAKKDHSISAPRCGSTGPGPGLHRSRGDSDLVWCHEGGRPIDASQDWDEWKVTPLPGRSREKRARPRCRHDHALLPHHSDTLNRSSSSHGPGSLGLTATGNATGRASGSWRWGSPPRSLVVGRPGLEPGTYGSKVDRPLGDQGRADLRVIAGFLSTAARSFRACSGSCFA